MKFSVPNRFDGGRGTPSIKFAIYAGKDRINHEKVVEFKGSALKSDPTLFSLIQMFLEKDQASFGTGRINNCKEFKMKLTESKLKSSLLRQ